MQKDHLDNQSEKKPYEYISLLSPRFILIIGGLLALLVIVFMRLGAVKEQDLQEYKEMMEDAQSSHSTAKKTPYTATQNRERVQKDFFFEQGNERLQIRLMASDAQLVLDHTETDTQLVEHMQNVKCTMQEELYYKLPNGKEALLQENGKLLIRQSNPEEPSSWIAKDSPGLIPMQLVRFIDADKAQYEYKTDRFVANHVRISRYTLPGHQLVEIGRNTTPLMSGTAGRVEFSLKNKNHGMHFKAYQLKATFQDTSRLNL